MALPVALLHVLQLDIRRKIGLAFAFCLALITISFALVRMTQVISGTTIDMLGLALWGTLESMVALIVGCLPPLKALISGGIRNMSTRRSAPLHGNSYKSGRGFSGHGTGSRAVVTSVSIPLDDMQNTHHAHDEGRIYVQKTYETVHETGSIATDEEALQHGGHH